jgi:autotransporter-associated beta strand protein
MKTSLRFIACAAVGCLIGAASVAHGQTTWIGASGGEWNSAPNWNPATVPNATGASAVFTGTTQVNLTSFNATTGTLTFGGTGGNLVVGNNATTNDVLTFAVSSGSPTVSATNSNATIFMYANVEGTQGITKSGAGKFTFRFNSAAQTYSGPISITGGIYGIDGDQSLGNVDNDVTIAHGARLTVEPGSNTGTVTLPATRTITFTSGTGQLGVSPAAVTAIVSGSVLGAGGFTKTDAGNLTFNGPVSYQGATRVLGGIVDFNSGAYSGTGSILVQGGTGTQLTMADLTSVTVNGPGSTVLVQPATTASGTFACDWVLSTGGANSITAASVSVGGASGSSQGSSNTGAIRLGTGNTINTGSLGLGGFNGRGEVTLQSGLTSPTVTIRGVSGGSTAVPTAVIGDTSSGSRTGEGLLDLNGATVDALFGTVVIGRHIANSNNVSTSGILFNSGTLQIQSGTLAVMTGTGTPTLAAAITQGGGVGKVQSLMLGLNTNGTAATSLPVFQSAYNLNGGTLYAGTITSGTGSSGAAARRTIAINGGTLRNYDASTDLVATGLDATPNGQLTFALGAAGGTFEADAGRSITLGAFTAVTGSGSLTKVGPGTLVIGRSAAHTGATTVSAGTLLVDGLLGATSGVTVAAGATLAGSGTVAAPVSMSGVLAPGSTGGLLTMSSLSLQSSAAAQFQISGTSRGVLGGYEAVDVTQSGGLTYGGGVELSIGSLFSDNTSFNLFGFSGAPAGGLTSVSATGAYGPLSFTGAGGVWTALSGPQTLTFTESTGTLVIVPEPTALLSGAMAAAMVLVMGLRSRRHDAR